MAVKWPFLLPKSIQNLYNLKSPINQIPEEEIKLKLMLDAEVYRYY
jgi:hypothetical protein